ncbi:hypothetical protein ACLOJK_008474 [Asimina triloba]
MASMLSLQDQDYTIEDVPVIDSSLLMDFLEEPLDVDEIKDERLGCVIRSLEAEIDRNAMDDGCRGLIMPDCGLDNVKLVDGEDCSTSMSHVDDPFDWVDVDMVSDSHYGGMGNWYLDTCMDEIGMGGYEDGRDYSNILYYGEGCMEQMCSPLWEDA